MTELTIRRAFEKWAKSKPAGIRPMNLKRSGEGYHSTRTSVAWIAYQAGFRCEYRETDEKD